ncbi:MULTISPECIES: AraC family transcriptional regulator [Paenibacillus]|uniref:AraC family transcriptional regulator n=1 Tax=Paenibacillus campinasensis TaxID=66347 RepID=A0A268EPD7_9BACL|nr:MULTISPECIES: AraC family transcriptional regulator [Paenibacillus]MUG66154.1 AraC family transcriptional regulator [Paenibacillus campinasensis]PAD74985.1 AraC family transcriptional regulator [Paenibacillus campinasensis]PAK50181.1 AraC family transcriptional regulator [Paenibacillus sp. 7541]
MTFVLREEAIPKEKVRLARNYPVLIADTIGVTSLYQKLHWHNVLEINYIKSGTGYYVINGKKFEFEQGDVLLINSNDLHCAYESQDLVMLVISFDSTWFIHNLRFDPELFSPFREMGKHFSNLIPRDHPAMDKLRPILLQMQAEHEQEQRSYTTMVHSLLLQFLATVNRECRFEGQGRSEPSISERQLEKMRQVIMIMEENYAHPWTLEELAALVYLSPSRFSEIFKRAVGMPPLLYLIHIRLEQAIKLLEGGQMKVTDVALECGFRTLTNFNRLFKKHVGMTPKASQRQQL